MLGITTPALCAGYDELNAGISEYIDGNWDGVITHLDKAIAANDLIPSLMLVAHRDRAIAHLAKRDWQAAAADITASIEIKPDDFRAWLMRARTYEAAGDLAKSHADVMQASSLTSDQYVQRAIGFADWRLGYFGDAADAFAKSFAGPDANPYSWLWLQMGTLKNGKPNSDASDPLAGKPWPSPIASYFLGKSGKEDVFKAASGVGSDQANGAMCEANFYVGEWELLHDQAEGRSYLQKAADACPKNFLELGIAEFELKTKP